MNEKTANDNDTRTRAVLSVLDDPMRNRGVAFSAAEREALGLTGRLPAGVLDLEQQARRVYRQLQAQGSDLAKNVYLEQLHDRNEVLYYRVLADHLTELLPVVYDPTVGRCDREVLARVPPPAGHLPVHRPAGRDREGLRHARARARGRGPDRVYRRGGDPRHRRLGRGRHRDRGGQAGRVHRGGGHRPAPGHPGVAGRRHRQRRAAERPALPGQPARPGPRRRLRRLHRQVPGGRFVAVPGRAAALRGLRRGQRPADPAVLPGQVPDLQRRHAGHRGGGHGRACSTR